MAKRDFVDHCDLVDPVGESKNKWSRWLLCWNCLCAILPKCPVYLSDGVVLVDPEQVKGKKGLLYFVFVSQEVYSQINLLSVVK